METEKPIIDSQKSIIDNITDDLKEYFKAILVKHLDDRAYNETKIKNWTDNILLECKEYFIKKYPDYDLFLYCFVCERNVYFKDNNNTISNPNDDNSYSISFFTNNLFSDIYFFFYRHYTLDYSLNKFEASIIKEGNEIILKHLENRKYNYDKIGNYNIDINKDHLNYILEKNNKLKCFAINRIFKYPIEGKYDFNYLSHGKDIYRVIFQTYQNDSLFCTHDVFFFK